MLAAAILLAAYVESLVLVTGGASALGSNVVREVLKTCETAVLVDSGLSNESARHVDELLDFVGTRRSPCLNLAVEIVAPSEFNTILARYAPVDVVIHATPEFAEVRLEDWAKTTSVVVASSLAVYGNESSELLDLERKVREQSRAIEAPSAVVRLASLETPDASSLEPAPWVHVADAARGLLRAGMVIRESQRHQVWNLSSSHPSVDTTAARASPFSWRPDYEAAHEVQTEAELAKRESETTDALEERLSSSTVAYLVSGQRTRFLLERSVRQVRTFEELLMAKPLAVDVFVCLHDNLDGEDDVKTFSGPQPYVPNGNVDLHRMESFFNGDLGARSTTFRMLSSSLIRRVERFVTEKVACIVEVGCAELNSTTAAEERQLKSDLRTSLRPENFPSKLLTTFEGALAPHVSEDKRLKLADWWDRHVVPTLFSHISNVDHAQNLYTSRWTRGRMFFLRHACFILSLTRGTYSYYMYVRDDNVWLGPTNVLRAFARRQIAADQAGTVWSPERHAADPPRVAVDKFCGWGSYSDKIYLTNYQAANVLYANSLADHIGNMARWLKVGSLRNHNATSKKRYPLCELFYRAPCGPNAHTNCTHTNKPSSRCMQTEAFVEYLFQRGSAVVHPLDFRRTDARYPKNPPHDLCVPHLYRNCTILNHFFQRQKKLADSLGVLPDPFSISICKASQSQKS